MSRSAGPSARARASARSAAPSASRAAASAVSGGTPWRVCSRWLSSAGVAASKRTSWQREAVVGRMLPGRFVSSTRCANGGGSSSVLSSLLAAWSFMVSAPSMTKTRRRASNGVRVAAPMTGSSMSPTSISAAPLGRTQVRSGWTPSTARRLASEGSPAPSARGSAAKARAASRLPAPAGPWNRYACDGAPAGGTAAVRIERAWGWRSTTSSMRAPGYCHASVGRLIAIEGIDGAGKTTLAAGLARAVPALVVLREPGGAEVAERIRELVKDPALNVDPRAEALLYAAARAQLVGEVLQPLLASGRDVVLDRYVDSSLAYQGAGRG